MLPRAHEQLSCVQRIDYLVSEVWNGGHRDDVVGLEVAGDGVALLGKSGEKAGVIWELYVGLFQHGGPDSAD